MKRNQRFRCFVAMAFSHDDVDIVYDRGIAPILRRNGVEPIRVDRREDNRDINQQIIELLNTADFCIADLSYARPSVYFEAGYAQRQMEVIYTVRSDHLDKGQPEDCRVHFDLQMKPLIKWREPRDPTFPSRLERRIRQTALKRLMRKRAFDERGNEERKRFFILSMNERLALLRRIVYSELRKLGFRHWLAYHKRVVLSSLPMSLGEKMADLHGLDTTFTGFVLKGKVLSVVSYTAGNNITLGRLRDEIMRWAEYDFCARNIMDKAAQEAHITRQEIAKIEEHHLVLSLGAIPKTRITAANPNAKPDATGSRFCLLHNHKERLPERNKEKVIPRSICYHFVDRISSQREMEKKLRDVLRDLTPQ